MGVIGYLNAPAQKTSGDGYLAKWAEYCLWALKYTSHWQHNNALTSQLWHDLSQSVLTSNPERPLPQLGVVMIANKKTDSQWRPSLRAPQNSLYENREWTKGVNSLTAFVVPKWVSCRLLVNGKWANDLKSDFKRRYKPDECILPFQSHHFNEGVALRMLTSFSPFNMIILFW